MGTRLELEVAGRFGLLPNFFRLASSDPQITENLWGFAQFAYLDNPLPSLFKERLFVYLSRFCEVRYCLARHVGFLIGQGRPAGDAACAPQTIDAVLPLLQRPLVRGNALVALLKAVPESAYAAGFPEPDSVEEQAMIASATHVFLQTPDAVYAHQALARRLRPSELEHLNVFLSFVRTAHYWTTLHPELVFEADIDQLLAKHEALQECILHDPAVREFGSAERQEPDTIESLREMRKLQGRLAAIVESSEDAIVSKDLNGVIQSWNTGAEQLFGYQSEEVIGQPITIIIPPDRLAEESEILKRLQLGERVEHFETIRQRKDGTLLDISLTISPVRGDQGEIVGASKIARDITERRRQEQALQAANNALTRANADLEQFTYSSSHDLQEPLRMISAYSQILQQRFGGQLGSEGEQFIGYLVEGATRMQQLLEHLRTFTRAATMALDHPEIVDASTVLQRTLANLKTAIDESGAEITHGELPALVIHEFQLEQLFQNLIGNAIRYRGERRPAVHVEGIRSEGNWLFSVRDNGIGIDAQYQEHIFGIFTRLHTRADYPGTGMGLAICQRIVERVGGRIWVESEAGKGSTFFFTVPVVEVPN